MDQTTEVTVNKDTQTPGGTGRFSLKAGAIKMYYITAEHRSAFLGQIRGMVQGKKSGLHHAELQRTRIKNEEAVSAVVHLIEGWVNPFAEKQELISISTARTAPRDIDGRHRVASPGTLPRALSTHDGLLRKTNKATLATTLQKNVAVAEQFPGNSASVVDGMNLVQRVKGDQATFRDVATTVLSMALKEGSQSNRIDVVFDKYQENSIKNSERSVRGGETGHQLQSITGAQIVRQWRTFLSRITNKTSLITFIVSEWRKAQYMEKLHGKVLYATG